MSMQVRHPSVSQEEEEDERFIQESTELAKSFTEFFINSQAQKIKRLQGTHSVRSLMPRLLNMCFWMT